MGLGTKNRQNQTAELCKNHLRTLYRAQAVLVEDFVREVEGVGAASDPARWGQFTDVSRDPNAMFARLDACFNRWLNGDV